MSEQNGDFSGQIAASASKVLEQNKHGIDYVAQEQGGIHKSEGNLVETLKLQDRITSLTGIASLTGELRTILFKQADKGEITDSSLLDPAKRVVEHQESFVRELLGSNPSVISQLAEIEAKLKLALEVSNSGEGSNQDFLDRATAWNNTVHAISNSLCGDEDTKNVYHQLVERNYAALNQPQEITTQGADGSPETRTKASYRDRLISILKNPKAQRFLNAATDSKRGEELTAKLTDEYLETAFTLNAVRALDRIQRPLGWEAKHRKLLACLDGRETNPKYAQLIVSTGLTEQFQAYRDQLEQVHKSNLPHEEEKAKIKALKEEFKTTCRPHLEAFFSGEADTDEVVDIIGTKLSVEEIKRRAIEINSANMSEDEKKTKLAELDGELQNLIIPIANKVDRVFPHEKSTTLTDVLEHEDAVCAGKVNVLLATSKFFGLNARANGVLELMDNDTFGHVCFECDLPSGKKLVVDSNFSNKAGLESKTEAELIEVIKQRNPGIKDDEIPSMLNTYRRMIADAPYIPKESRVLLYQTENTTQSVEGRAATQTIKDTDYRFIRINPYTGKKEVWSASVPYPHQITSPDKDGYLFINSSFCYNTAKFSRNEYGDIRKYLYKRLLEMSPYETETHIAYVDILETEEAITYLERLKEEKPGVFYDGANYSLADLYIEQGEIDKAEAEYQDLKERDPEQYFCNVHRLVKAIVNSINEDDPEHSTRLERARTIIEGVKAENPQAYSGEADNIKAHLSLYLMDFEQQTKILEELEQANPDSFWNSSDIQSSLSFPKELMYLYESDSQYTPNNRQKVIAFYERSRQLKPEFYVNTLSSYVRKLEQAEGSDPIKALNLYEDARRQYPKWFHTIDENTKTLANLWFDQGLVDIAIEVYQEAERVNPEDFWNQESTPVYESLVSLFENSNQVEQAILVCEQAATKSKQFWQQSFIAGYFRLVELFRKVGNLDGALNCCLKAQSNDPEFFSPTVDGNGYIQLAAVYKQTGQTDLEIATLEAGRDKDNNFWQVQYIDQPGGILLANAYKEAGQIEHAIKAYEDLRAHNIKEFWMTNYYQVCSLYQQRGNREKAQQLRAELIGVYEHIRSTDEVAYENYGYDKLANLYEEAGDQTSLLKILEDGKAKIRFFPTKLHKRLIQLYVDAGNLNKAQSSCRDLIKIFKDDGLEDRVAEVVKLASDNGITLTED